jgi:hypothetical protein
LRFDKETEISGFSESFRFFVKFPVLLVNVNFVNLVNFGNFHKLRSYPRNMISIHDVRAICRSDTIDNNPIHMTTAVCANDAVTAHATNDPEVINYTIGAMSNIPKVTDAIVAINTTVVDDSDIIKDIIINIGNIFKLATMVPETIAVAFVQYWRSGAVATNAFAGLRLALLRVPDFLRVIIAILDNVAETAIIEVAEFVIAEIDNMRRCTEVARIRYR